MFIILNLEGISKIWIYESPKCAYIRKITRIMHGRLGYIVDKVHWKSIESPSDIRRTWHLTHSGCFLPLRPSEVRRTSDELVSPMLFCFKMTSPDWDRTGAGQAADFGQFRRIPSVVQRTVQLSPSELAGSGQSPLDSVGKQGGV